MTKILLVEDDKSLREIYGVRLLAEGYDIVSAGDGEEALAMAIKERPALIVSDVMMPKISGFDMLDILRSATETKDIKVIMMTALSSEDQRQRGESLGADRYLVKSQVGIEDVVRTVHEVLGDLPGVGTNPVPTKQPTAAPAAPQPATRPDVASLSPQPSLTPTHIPVAPTPQPDPLANMQSAAQAPASAPAVPTPAPQPMPQPATPAPAIQPAPAAAPEPQPAAQAATLPQPTAPFSSPVPRPNSLGDRVIQPISAPDDNAVNVAELIEQELSMPTVAPAPAAEAPATSEQPEAEASPHPVPEAQPVVEPAPVGQHEIPANPQPAPTDASAMPAQPTTPPPTAPNV